MKKNDLIPISIAVMNDEDLYAIDKAVYAEMCFLSDENGVTRFTTDELLSRFKVDPPAEIQITNALNRLNGKLYIRLCEPVQANINVFYITGFEIMYKEANRRKS